MAGMDPKPMFEELLPRLTGWRSSITTTEAFELLYNNFGALQHFKLTKRELPLQQVMLNEKFLKAIAAYEGGTRLDYEVLRAYVGKFRTRHGPSLENLCQIMDTFLVAHDIATTNVARYISFSLHIDVSKAYYQPSFDMPLLKLLAATTPDDLQKYVDEALAFQNPDHQAILQQKLRKYRSAAEYCMSQVIEFKCSVNMTRSLRDFNDFVTLYDQTENLKHDTRLLVRMEAAQRLRVKAQASRSANVARFRSQLGQIGRFRMRTTLVDAMIDLNKQHSATYLNGGKTLAEGEQSTEEGDARHPDSWEALHEEADEEVLVSVNAQDAGSTN